MKKIAFFTILSIFAITNQLQAQEPTKQETIDWIAGKFMDFGKTTFYLASKDASTTTTRSFKEREGNKIIIIVTDHTIFKSPSSTSISISNESIDLSRVTNVKVDDKGLFEIQGSNLTEYTYKDNRKEITSKLVISSPAFVYDGKSYPPSGYIDFLAEPNLRERMIKAFENLAKFNNAEKPKEKY